MIRSTLAAICLASTAQAELITVIPLDGLPWKDTPEGVAFADLHGARFQESYMSMVRLPAGTVSPAHIKTANMHGVIISGTMTHVPADTESDGQPLSVGAYYHVPANLPHISSCISDHPCVTFLYQDGAFDFVPVAQ